jgi:phosphoenolpyruvate synthase/pyruvate phosphate dikinase
MLTGDAKPPCTFTATIERALQCQQGSPQIHSCDIANMTGLSNSRLPCEILVTRATDPGWTPLFINAAGVILEIGDSIQHGALVAREYGKPRVARVENATQVFEDGQIVSWMM